ncbi:Uncharacterised protein [Neisseria gonorrhoeae]|nr:Uncharacterised protein [Neisseria gonorrhoeae]SBM90952.1 Uncharacterised protein [Neisseria gonorrhoeae]
MRKAYRFTFARLGMPDVVERLVIKPPPLCLLRGRGRRLARVEPPVRVAGKGVTDAGGNAGNKALR